MRGVRTQGRVMTLGPTLTGKEKGEVEAILLDRMSQGSTREQRSNL